ncbi:uncharacterized protein LOC119355371 [Triticum dicoccoides]|uniref:uncharacterized protein LOC119355371 n=1 Tax=Triticum dicoccoides TaxID=85692 RepID=UPI00188F5EB4|nr:uncharacterized protein LOC119355371 [Triticum dicoccoides]
MEKYLIKKSRDVNTTTQGPPVTTNSSSGSGNASRPVPRHNSAVPALIDLNKLPRDPSKRKRMADYHPNQRDEIRRKYLIWGPNQPDIDFPYREFGKKKKRRRDNIKDSHHGHDAFVVEGFNSWNKPERFVTHVGNRNSFHNRALKDCEDLLKQGQPFRGHNESKDSENKGNYRELLGLNIKQVRGQGYDGAILLNVVGASCKRKNQLREHHQEEVRKAIGCGEISTGTGLNQEQSFQRPGGTRWNSHYKTLLGLSKMFSSVVKFNDRFNEVNSELLLYMSALSPSDLFCHFDKAKLLKLAKHYPDNFNHKDMVTLEHELGIYIDNILHDTRFSSLEKIGHLAKLMVDTRKHLSYPLVYRLLKLALTLPVATGTVERCFSSTKIVKNALRNRIGDDYLSHSLICFVEKGLLDEITNEVIVDRFHKMKDRRGKNEI